MSFNLGTNIQELNCNLNLTQLEQKIIANGENKLGGAYYGALLNTSCTPKTQQNPNQEYYDMMQSAYKSQYTNYETIQIEKSTTPGIITAQLNDIVGSTSVTVKISSSFNLSLSNPRLIQFR